MGRWERWSPISGILFVPLFVFGAGVLEANTAETPDAVREYYLDKVGLTALAFYALLAAALCLVWFAAALRSVLVRVEEEPRSLTALGFGSGVAAAALIVAGGALLAALGEQGAELDPGSAGLVDTASYFLITGGISVAALLVLATSLVARRGQLLPRWLTTAGFVVAPLTFFAPASLPALLFPLWILAVSVVLLVQRSQEQITPPSSRRS